MSKSILLICLIIIASIFSLFAIKTIKESNIVLKESSEFTLLVKFTVKPESLKNFEKATLFSLDESRKEAGNLEMKLYHDQRNENIIYVYSRWINDKAYKVHNEMPHTKSLREVVVKSIETNPEIVKLTEID